ncbi:hypothetical protein [Paraburkholderia strydomiana]|nr:hypothetical protein [Paraburkholderia strydomiana]MDR7006182.1 hypothetical protein [Paraburkholderia strydomiana]
MSPNTRRPEIWPRDYPAVEGNGADHAAVAEHWRLAEETRA